MSTHPTPLLDHHTIEDNFRELEPALSDAEAILESNRCLFCFDAPCTRACPTHIDVPKFIKKIASGNLIGSARTIFEANPIGASCARVCPVEALCVGACVENALAHQPIMIGRLQRYATDAAMKTGRDLFKAGESNGKSVGIVGSGPAEIACATYLARLGYDVTIYERRALPGGLDTYGMAEYKMTQRVSLEEVQMVERLGVKILVNTEIGRDVSLADLESRHGAIFLGIGLGSTIKLGIPGEEVPGVYEALDFIERIKTREWAHVPIGKTVAVIGAGNTAVDAATQAKRLGAEEVLMIYRRSEREMPAYSYEYELAKQDAIEFRWHTAPVEILSNEDGTGVKAVLCVRTQLGEPDEKGRRKFEFIPGTEFEIKADMVVKALGQQKLVTFLSQIPGIELDELGRIKVNPETKQTANPKYFAGGDCVNGGREAVDAAQAGKHAAQGIHELLSGEKVKFAGA